MDEPILTLVKSKKKRYYKENEVFNYGRGIYQVKEADGRYYVKNREGWPESHCLDCCFHMNYPNKMCKILACNPDEREDKKDVIFVKI